MKIAAYTTLVFAIVVFSGGLVGFITAHSLPSLLAGTIFGSLLIVSCSKMFKHIAKAQLLALFQSVVLGAFFAYRYLSSYKFIPAGLMVIISALVVFVLISTMPKKRSKAS